MYNTFVFKNLCQLFNKYAVVRTEHDALVKCMTKIFSNLLAFSENPNFNKYDITKTGLVGRKACLMVGIVLTELPTTEGGGTLPPAPPFRRPWASLTTTTMGQQWEAHSAKIPMGSIRFWQNPSYLK